MSAKNHTVVISDVHLCDAMPGDGLWLRYRQKHFFPDADFAALFDRLLKEARDGRLEMVFDGDLFDFDTPPIKGEDVSVEDLPRDEPTSVQTLARILDDHAVFVAAAGRLLAAGHRLSFLPGNHDPQITFAGVRALLRERLLRAARAAGSTEEDRALEGRISFHAWFHRTADGIHIEHGNQYDPYCSFRYPTEPFTGDGKAIQPTLGSLACRNLVSKMGYFNAYNDSGMILSVPEYLLHWARYYLFTRRSLILSWVKGSIRTFVTTWRSKTPEDAERISRMIAEVAHATGTDPARVREQTGLFAPPSEDARFRVLRELGLDRVFLLVAGMAAALVTLSLSGKWAMLEAFGIAIVGIILYELAMAKKPTLAEMYADIDASERKVAAIHGAKAIVFGHTHVPFGIWENGKFYGNSGTWSPGYRDIECKIPLSKGRPVIWLRSNGNGTVEGGLYRWEDGEFTRTTSSW